MGNLGRVFSQENTPECRTEIHKSSFFPYKQVSWRNGDHEWLRMTNAFILCDLVWKVQKSHSVNREGSLNYNIYIRILCYTLFFYEKSFITFQCPIHFSNTYRFVIFVPLMDRAFETTTLSEHFLKFIKPENFRLYRGIIRLLWKCSWFSRSTLGKPWKYSHPWHHICIIWSCLWSLSLLT